MAKFLRACEENLPRMHNWALLLTGYACISTMRDRVRLNKV